MVARASERRVRAGVKSSKQASKQASKHVACRGAALLGKGEAAAQTPTVHSAKHTDCAARTRGKIRSQKQSPPDRPDRSAAGNDDDLRIRRGPRLGFAAHSRVHRARQEPLSPISKGGYRTPGPPPPGPGRPGALRQERTSGPYVGRFGPNGCLPNRLHDGGRAPAPASACTCAGTRARICTNRTATVPASAVTSPGALGRPLACCGACGARSRCNGARRARGTCCACRSYRAHLACRCSGCFEWERRRRRRRRFAPRPV